MLRISIYNVKLFFLHFTDFLRKVYGILSVQLLFTFLTASVFKWSSVITYIVQTKSVVVKFYTNYESTKLLKMLTFVGSEMQMQIIFLSITLSTNKVWKIYELRRH